MTSLPAAPAPVDPDVPAAAAASTTLTPAAFAPTAAPVATLSPALHRASSVRFASLADLHREEAGTARGAMPHSTYATVGTDTTFALREALQRIEGGGHAVQSCLQPSGLAAITTALLAFLRPGDEWLMPDSVYGPTRYFAEGMLREMGVVVRVFDPTAGAELEALCNERTRVIYLESPGSYTFELQDVPAICAMARRRGIVTMLDNTYGSPGLVAPFDWGVDISLLALTKYWGGHADVLMGAIVARDEHWAPIWRTTRQLGQCVGGDDAWLVLRGLPTAAVRLRQHEATALTVARWLEAHPAIAQVLHPALPSHPQHARFVRDFRGANGLFSFALKAPATPEAMAALCDGRRHFHIAYSWGGVQSLIMPADMAKGRTVRPWQGGALVRVHCGLQTAQELIDDLSEGLDGWMKKQRS